MKKPFWWKKRKAWYVKLGPNNQKKLHEDEAKAYRIWQEMLSASSPESSTATFQVIAEHYLRAVASEVSGKTLRGYGDDIVSACGTFGSVLVRDLKPFHSSRWITKKTTWGSQARRRAIAAVKRCLNWAVDEGLLDRNPLASVKKPQTTRRQGLIAEDEHARMMTAVDEGRKSAKKKTQRRDSCFRVVLMAMKHSGCRPGSIGAVMIEDVTADSWTVHVHKTRKKTGKPLTIYLSPCLQTLTRISANGRTNGPLFLNSLGKAWTSNAIRCRMKELRKKLGLPNTAIAAAYRHTYITTALVNGADVATVAELVGHSDLKMISQHYGHLDKKKDHLKQAAAKAVKKPDNPTP